jgi:hypothetical protein
MVHWIWCYSSGLWLERHLILRSMMTLIFYYCFISFYWWCHTVIEFANLSFSIWTQEKELWSPHVWESWIQSFGQWLAWQRRVFFFWRVGLSGDLKAQVAILTDLSCCCLSCCNQVAARTGETGVRRRTQAMSRSTSKRRSRFSSLWGLDTTSKKKQGRPSINQVGSNIEKETCSDCFHGCLIWGCVCVYAFFIDPECYLKNQVLDTKKLVVLDTSFTR